MESAPFDITEKNLQSLFYTFRASSVKKIQEQHCHLITIYFYSFNYFVLTDIYSGVLPKGLKFVYDSSANKKHYFLKFIIKSKHNIISSVFTCFL